MPEDRQRHLLHSMAAALSKPSSKTMLTFMIALALLLTGGAYLIFGPGSPERGKSISEASTPSPTARPTIRLPSRAIIGPDRSIATLPDVLAAVQTVIPAELKSAALNKGVVVPERHAEDDQVYVWNLSDASRERQLKVFVNRFESAQHAHGDYLFRRRSNENIDHPKKVDGDDVSLGVHTNFAKAVSGVGDEAFFISEQTEGEIGFGGASYNSTGVITCSRYKNIIIIVEYRGADYSGVGSGGKHMEATALPQDESRRTSNSVINAILGVLQG